MTLSTKTTSPGIDYIHQSPKQINPALYCSRFLNYNANLNGFDSYNTQTDEVFLLVEGYGQDHIKGLVAGFTLQRLTDQLDEYLELPRNKADLKEFVMNCFHKIHEDVFKFSLERVALLGAEAAILMVIVRKKEIFIASVGNWVIGKYNKTDFELKPLHQYFTRLGSSTAVPQVYFDSLKLGAESGIYLGTQNTLLPAKDFFIKGPSLQDSFHIGEYLKEYALIDYQCLFVGKQAEKISSSIEDSSLLVLDMPNIADIENNPTTIDASSEAVGIASSDIEEITATDWLEPTVLMDEMLLEDKLELLEKVVSNTDDNDSNLQVGNAILPKENNIEQNEGINNLIIEETSISKKSSSAAASTKTQRAGYNIGNKVRKYLSIYGIVAALILIMGFIGPYLENKNVALVKLSKETTNTPKPTAEDILPTISEEISKEDLEMLKKQEESFERLKIELAGSTIVSQLQESKPILEDKKSVSSIKNETKPNVPTLDAIKASNTAKSFPKPKEKMGVAQKELKPANPLNLASSYQRLYSINEANFLLLKAKLTPEGSERIREWFRLNKKYLEIRKMIEKIYDPKIKSMISENGTPDMGIYNIYSNDIDQLRKEIQVF